MFPDERVINTVYFDATNRWAAQWERYGLDALPDRIASADWKQKDVFGNHAWKISRATRQATLQLALDIDDDFIPTVAAASREDGKSFDDRIDMLTSYGGIAEAAASAQLMFAAPDRFTVYDSNVRDALAELGVRDTADLTPGDVNTAVRTLADDYGLSMRVVDRALWMHASDRTEFSL